MIVKKKWGKLLRALAIIFLVMLALLISSYIVLITHKKEISATVVNLLNENINGKVSLSDIRFSLFEQFPSISARARNLIVTDSLMGRPDTVLVAKELSIIYPIGNLLSRQKVIKSILLSGAKISLVKSLNGKSNLALFKNNNESGQSNLPRPKKLLIRNVSFSYRDSLKQKFFRFNIYNCTVHITYGDSSVHYTAKSSLHFDHLIFNPNKGGYLTDKRIELNVDGEINPRQNKISVSHGTAKVDKQEIDVRGQFNLGKNPAMNLNFFSHSLKADVAYSLLSKNILTKISQYHFYKPMMIYATISGGITSGTIPKVDVYARSSSNRIDFGHRSFDDLTLLAWFSNHADSLKDPADENSQLLFPVFNGLMVGVPMKTRIRITNFKSPFLVMSAASDIDKNWEQNIVDPARFKVLSGSVHFKFSFSGPLKNYFDTVNNRMNASIHGSIVLHDLALDCLSKDFEFRKVNGVLLFDSSDLHISTISLELNHNHGYINGDFKQLIPFLFTSMSLTRGNLTLTAATIDLNNFKFEKDTSETKHKKNFQRKEEKAKSEIAIIIDRMMDRFELNFKLTAQKVLYKNFTADNLESILTYSNDFIHFKELSMNVAGGNFSFNGSVSKLSDPKHEVDLAANIQNADISSLFKNFDNFGQDIVTSHDVDGKLQADISFHTQLAHGFKVIPSSLNSKMTVSIKDGELKNFESIKQISNYIFKNRDFDNIKFSGVENEYQVTGSEINFSHLDVYSTVLTFFAEGKYDFNKTNTLMLIHVPLGNLSKSKTEELAEHPDSTMKSGPSVTFKATYGDDDKMHIVPVVFGKKKIKDGISENKKNKH